MFEITKPSLVVDEIRVKRNVERIAMKAKKSSVRFRPHFKTHQSAIIGEWFKELGISTITVSSLDMAEYFASHSWNDIIVAVPTNIKQIEIINSLARSLTLNLLVESTDTATFLKKSVQYPINIWIEIDVGYGRSGIRWQNKELIKEIAQIITQADKLLLQGILTHAGQTYQTTSVAEIEQIHHDSILQMNDVQNYLLSKGFPDIEISIGDTPTCSIRSEFSGVDEIRPGNIVFYDLQQVRLGACDEKDIAITVACPVIGKYPHRSELVIYGGAIHLSKEFLLREDGSRTFGKIVLPTNNGWGKPVSNAYVSGISQEHGIIKADKDFINKIKIGDILMILPIHSCLTANLYKNYHSIDGRIIENIHS
jgi:D-serine deaminase-like pyridoxal phosphate-dependent protein